MAYFTLLIYTILLYIRPQDIYPDASFASWPVMPTTIALTAVFALSSGQLNILRLFSIIQNKLIVLLLVAVGLSHLAQLRFLGAWESAMFFVNVIVIFLLIPCILDSPKKIKGYIILLILIAVFLAYQGVEQFLTGTSLGGHTPMISGDGTEIRVRWVGTLNDPNDLALVLVVTIPFLLFFIVSQKKWIPKGAAIFILSLIIYAVVLTKSRGGYISLAGMFYLFFAMRYRGIKSALMGSIGFFVLFLILPERLVASLAGGQFIDYGRVEAWSEGLQMIKSNPIFGVGHRRFQEFHVIAAHNSYVELISETGILGGFFWASIFYVTLRDIYRVHGYNQAGRLEDRYGLNEIATAIFIALMGFLAAAFFLSREYTVFPFILVAVWVATGKLIQRENEGLYFRFKPRDISVIFCLVVGFILFIYFAVRFLWSAK